MKLKHTLIGIYLIFIFLTIISYNLWEEYPIKYIDTKIQGIKILEVNNVIDNYYEVRYIYSHDYIRNRTEIKYFRDVNDIEKFKPNKIIGSFDNGFLYLFCLLLSLTIFYPFICFGIYYDCIVNKNNKIIPIEKKDN
jgi:hypothetical protein